MRSPALSVVAKDLDEATRAWWNESDPVRRAELRAAANEIEKVFWRRTRRIANSHQSRAAAHARRVRASDEGKP